MVENVNRSMFYHVGEVVFSFHYNQIRNISVTLLKQVYETIRVDPHLQQLTDETLQSSAFTGKEVRFIVNSF